jgi:hypothetical protein
MNILRQGSFLLLVLAASPLHAADEAKEKLTPKQALQAFNDLIGDWRATGTPEGSREEQRKNFWTESMSWSWKFKGDDAWLTISFEKGKNFTKGEMRYLPEKAAYQLELTTVGKEKLTYTGKLKERRLALERKDESKKETQRLIVSLLHANRFLYRYEVQPQGKAVFNRIYQVGCTKEGVPFAAGDDRPECVVSGGLGTRPVTYMGKTYYVCCGGCAETFKDNPEKYVKEFEAKKAKAK